MNKVLWQAGLTAGKPAPSKGPRMIQREKRRAGRAGGEGRGSAALLLSPGLAALVPVFFGSSRSCMIHCLCLQGDEMA